jgi:hypothetical protein
MDTIKVSCRISAENVEWLDEQVRIIGERKTSRNAEIEKAIVPRRVSMLPKWQQDKIAKHVAAQQEAGGGGGSSGVGGGDGKSGDAGSGATGKAKRGVEQRKTDDLFEPGSDERGDSESETACDEHGEMNPGKAEV